MMNPTSTKRTPSGLALRCFSILLAGLALLIPAASHTADTVCARVKIEIQQELTMERQGFDAMMRIIGKRGQIYFPHKTGVRSQFPLMKKDTSQCEENGIRAGRKG